MTQSIGLRREGAMTDMLPEAVLPRLGSFLFVRCAPLPPTDSADKPCAQVKAARRALRRVSRPDSKGGAS